MPILAADEAADPLAATGGVAPICNGARFVLSRVGAVCAGADCVCVGIGIGCCGAGDCDMERLLCDGEE